MKILITESQFNLINELKYSDHSMERTEDRIFNSDLTTKITYKVDNEYRTKIIGNYNIPSNIMVQIIKKTKFITNNIDNVINNITFGIYLHKFTFNEILNNTVYYDMNDMKEYKNLFKFNRGVISIVDDDTSSSGTSYVAIVTNNKLITTYFTGYYSKEKFENFLKKKSENVIVLESPEEMEYYYFNKDRNITALH